MEIDFSDSLSEDIDLINNNGTKREKPFAEDAPESNKKR